MSSGDQQNDGFETFDDGFEEAEYIPTEATGGDDEPVSPETTEAEATTELVQKSPATEEEDKQGKPGMMAAMTELSPYTVMLGISLVAVLVCIVILWSELSAYKFDRKAKDIPIITQSLELEAADGSWV